MLEEFLIARGEVWWYEHPRSDDASDGMPDPCALALDNVALVRTSLLSERIARLKPARMRAVCEALRVASVC